MYGKKIPDVFKSGGNIISLMVLWHLDKFVIIKFPLKWHIVGFCRSSSSRDIDQNAFSVKSLFSRNCNFFAKMTKTLKKCQIWPFQLVKWAYMVKIIKIHARNEFQGVLVQKIWQKNWKKFLAENPWFYRFFFSKCLKYPFLGPEIH